MRPKKRKLENGHKQIVSCIKHLINKLDENSTTKQSNSGPLNAILFREQWYASKISNTF